MKGHSVPKNGLPIFGQVALAISMGGHKDGLDTAVDLIQRHSEGLIPDKPRFRAALELWGIKIIGAGSPISQMFTNTPTLKFELPEGCLMPRASSGSGGISTVWTPFRSA